MGTLVKETVPRESSERWKMKLGDSDLGTVMHNKSVCGHLTILLQLPKYIKSIFEFYFYKTVLDLWPYVHVYL